jgi:ankyrin repeat protein
MHWTAGFRACFIFTITPPPPVMSIVRHLDHMGPFITKSPRTRLLCFGAIMVCAPHFCPGQAQAQGDQKFSVEIIAPRDASGNAYLPHGEAFEVHLTNLSKQPVSVWDDLCEPGYWALSFQVQGTNGESYTVVKRKVPATAWTNYPPKAVAVAPGEPYGRKVNLSDFFWGERAWFNPPEPNTGEMLEVKAVFEFKDTDEARQQAVWTGRAESAALRLHVLNPKLVTPQNYLWNACPRQALNLLRADPSLVNMRDGEDQCTPLHHAARFGYKDVVVWLIGHGADVNAKAYNEFTPLHLTERKDIAQILIKAGADLDQKDVWGNTALQNAAEEQHREVVEAILESGYKLNFRTALILKRRDVALKLLLHDSTAIVGGEGGSDLSKNVTPLGLAAAEGDLALMGLLIEAGAPINDPTDCVRYGGTATPLCDAVWYDKPEAAEYLLKRGAATDVVGGRFVRSLSEYVEKYSSKRIKELLGQYTNNPSLGLRAQTSEKIKNKLPERIASGEIQLPKQMGTKSESDKR